MSLWLGQRQYSISTVALIICRDVPKALCGIPSVLPGVWESTCSILEGRKDPLMLEPHSNLNLQARRGLSFQPQLRESHG